MSNTNSRIYHLDKNQLNAVWGRIGEAKRAMETAFAQMKEIAEAAEEVHDLQSFVDTAKEDLDAAKEREKNNEISEFDASVEDAQQDVDGYEKRLQISLDAYRALTEKQYMVSSLDDAVVNAGIAKDFLEGKDHYV
jgi:chromosome segregation ATPase